MKITWWWLFIGITLVALSLLAMMWAALMDWIATPIERHQ